LIQNAKVKKDYHKMLKRMGQDTKLLEQASTVIKGSEEKLDVVAQVTTLIYIEKYTTFD
jgi:hypothetical protein